MYFTYVSDELQVGETYAGQTITALWSGTDVTDTPKTKEPAWMGGHPLSWWGPMKRVVFDESFQNVRPHSTSYWFSHWNKLDEIVGLEYLNTSEVTDMQGMFLEIALTSLDLSTFDTSNVTNMSIMFGQNHTLTSLNLSSFDTSKVENMGMMFYDCSALTSLDLSNFDASHLTNAMMMFAACSSLELLYLDEFELSISGESCYYMFGACSSLEKIFCNHEWTITGSDADQNGMFYGCESLTGNNGTAYSEANTGGDYAQPDTDSKKGYFTPTYEVIQGRLAGDGYYWTTYYYGSANTQIVNAEGQETTMYVATLNADRKSLELVEIGDANAAKQQGIILKSNQQDIMLKHADIQATGDFSENALSGLDEKCAVPTDEGTIYTMSNKNGVLGFYKYTGSTLAAHRAYLALSEGSEAGFRFEFNADENVLTAIETVGNTPQPTKQSDAVYDMQGKRIVAPITTSGIYIVNGKKIFRK